MSKVDKGLVKRLAVQACDARHSAKRFNAYAMDLRVESDSDAHILASIMATHLSSQANRLTASLNIAQADDLVRFKD